MEIDVSIHQAKEPIAVMRVKGEINASNFVLVTDKAQEIYQKPARNLIIDLSEVPGISSTGIAAIHNIACCTAAFRKMYSRMPSPISPTAAMRASTSSCSIHSRKSTSLLRLRV